MAGEKRAHDFDCQIALACYIGAMFAGKFEPFRSNPFRQQYDLRELNLSKEQREEQSREQFKKLEAGLCSMFGKKYRNNYKGSK